MVGIDVGFISVDDDASPLLLINESLTILNEESSDASYIPCIIIFPIAFAFPYRYPMEASTFLSVRGCMVMSCSCLGKALNSTGAAQTNLSQDSSSPHPTYPITSPLPSHPSFHLSLTYQDKNKMCWVGDSQDNP
jgi:hypothetical protein